jgi:hypothetical protein
MYKEAQAAPPPSLVGGIIADCGSCTHDYPSARPFSAPLPFHGVVEFLFFMKICLLVIDDIAFKSQSFQK